MSKAKKQSRWQTAYPDEPWRWKPEWETGVVAGDSKKQAIGMALMGVVLLGVSLPGAWAIQKEVERGNYLILLVLLLSLVGLGFLRAAWTRARQFWRFGTVSFTMEPMPGSWGGYVGGVISIPKGARLRGDVKLQLQNLRLTESGSGKNRRVSEDVRWEADKEIAPASVAGADPVFDLPVLFHVPRDKGGPTNEDESGNQVVWRLRLTMKVAGLRGPLTAIFEIPVFDRGENLPVPKSPLLEGEKTRPISHYLKQAGVTEVREGTTWIWKFHQPTAWKSAGILVGMVAVFGAVGVLIPLLILKIAFLGTAGLLALMLPGIWWHRSELHVGPRRIEGRKKSWRGWRSWTLSRDEVGDLILAKSMKMGATQYFRMALEGAKGVDPELPHPLEHFGARKARYRWQRDGKKSAQAKEKAIQDLAKPPRFKVDVAGYLATSQAAERVREYLLERLTR